MLPPPSIHFVYMAKGTHVVLAIGAITGLAALSVTVIPMSNRAKWEERRQDFSVYKKEREARVAFQDKTALPAWKHPAEPK